MIACTFLLGLVKDGRDAHTNLGAYLQQNLGGPTTTDIQDIVKRLKARGGQEHMLMFLTGPYMLSVVPANVVKLIGRPPR